MGGIITLTTDFGLADGYVAAMKGVILSLNPQATIIDVTHNIQPQNILQAAFVISTVFSYFPADTIHLVVVDPGVGTSRRAVILQTTQGVFVAPDNGVLSLVIPDSTHSTAKPVVISITNPQYWQPTVSHTFHGRDIFAPVAAHLSLGVPIEEFGEPFTSLTVLPMSQPNSAPDGSLIGQVIHIDSFGNIITNFCENTLPAVNLTITIKNKSVVGLYRTYAEGKGLMALIGSSGYLEIVLHNGNASAYLGAKIGDEVRISSQS